MIEYFDIPNYEGLYKVDCNGNVLCLEKKYGRSFKMVLKERLMKHRYNSVGYKTVSLRDRSGCIKTHLVHRIIAKVFIPNPENKKEVNHIDGNKLNNHFSNLEWCTRLENEKHAYLTGLKRTGSIWGNSKKIIQKSIDGTVIKVWDCINDISREFNIDRRSIRHCCQGKRKTFMDCQWAYYE